jgi:hypothetical protein
MVRFNLILIPFSSRDLYTLIDGEIDKAFREYFFFGIRIARLSKNFEFQFAKLGSGLK